MTLTKMRAALAVLGVVGVLCVLVIAWALLHASPVDEARRARMTRMAMMLEDAGPDVSQKDLRAELEKLTRLRSAFAAGEFTPIEFGQPFADIKAMPDGARVESESHQWTERFLRPMASPWRRFIRVERAYRPTDDKLKADAIVNHYRYDDLGLAAYETSNELYLCVEEGADDLLALEAEKRVERLDEIAQKLLNVEGTRMGVFGSVSPYRWELLFKGEVRQGMTFTSAPDKLYFRMESWADRIDGGIAPFGLYFMLHKKVLESAGMQIHLEEAHWFDGLAWKRLDERYNSRYDRIRRERQEREDGGKR